MNKNLPFTMEALKFPVKIFLSACLLMASSCARKISFPASSVVPAADGLVKVKKDNNNNYAISITIRNLAKPNRLPEPKKVYVVWAESTKNGLQNLGQLNTTTTFSGALKASLNTVSPFKPKRIFITGEDVAATQYPGSYLVLDTKAF